MIQASIRVYGENSAWTPLPPAIEWEFTRADMAELDSFSYVFPFQSTLREQLSMATQFQIKENGAPLFTGMVDGYKVWLDVNESVCRIYGRSTAALLMDNEHPAEELSSPTTATIIRKYASANGVASYYDSAATAPAIFKVRLADSALRVLSNYGAAVGALPCRITADGYLRFTFTRENSNVTLTESDAVSARLLDRRRGVVSSFRLIEDEGYTPRQNTVFLGEGGHCTRYMKDIVYSDTYIIYETMRRRRQFQVTLPGTARLEPAANFTLNLPQLAWNGTLYVTMCKSSYSEKTGLLCEVTGAQY